MVEVIRNVLALNIQNLIPGLQLIAVGIWVLVVLAGIWSVAVLPGTPAKRLFWIAVIVLFPLVGLLFYCLQLIPRAEWGPLEGLKAAFAPKRVNLEGEGSRFSRMGTPRTDRQLPG